MYMATADIQAHVINRRETLEFFGQVVCFENIVIVHFSYPMRLKYRYRSGYGIRF